MSWEKVLPLLLCIKIYTNYMTARRHVYPVMSAPQSVRSGNGLIFNFLILVFRL